MFPISIATSKDFWIQASFLQKWVLFARGCRGERGLKHAGRDLVVKVDEIVNMPEGGRRQKSRDPQAGSQ